MRIPAARVMPRTSSGDVSARHRMAGRPASAHAWTASGDELLTAVEPSLRVLNPDYDRRWVRNIHVSRDRFAQPVPVAGGPMASLPLRTGLPGLFHASLAHVYPDDRGVSQAIRVGKQAGRLAHDELALPPSTSGAIGQVPPVDS